MYDLHTAVVPETRCHLRVFLLGSEAGRSHGSSARQKRRSMADGCSESSEFLSPGFDYGDWAVLKIETGLHPAQIVRVE